MTTKKEFVKLRNSYLVLKAAEKALDEQIDEIDRAITAKYGYSGLSWMIENCEEFEQILDEMQKIIDENGMQQEVNDIREALNQAALSFAFACVDMMPDCMSNYREVLRESVTKSAYQRSKVIDIGLKLDTKTIPATA